MYRVIVPLAAVSTVAIGAWRGMRRLAELSSKWTIMIVVLVLAASGVYRSVRRKLSILTDVKLRGYMPYKLGNLDKVDFKYFGIENGGVTYYSYTQVTLPSGKCYGVEYVAGVLSSVSSRYVTDLRGGRIVTVDGIPPGYEYSGNDGYLHIRKGYGLDDYREKYGIGYGRMRGVFLDYRREVYRKLLMDGKISRENVN